MKLKKFTLFIASFFILTALAGLTSAAVNFVNVTNSASSVEQGDAITVSFKVQETGSVSNLTGVTFNTPITLTKGSDTLSSASSVGGAITSLTQNTTSGVMTLVFIVSSSKPTGTYTGNLTMSGTYNSTPQSFNLPISLTVTESSTPDFVNNFCLFDDGVSSNPGQLDVKNIDLAVTGFGDDEQWVPFDEIEVEITVENDGDDDVDNIGLEWGLYDTDLDEWVIDVDEEDEFDLRDGDEETITFTFILDNDMDIDLEDLDDGQHYILFARATGEVDNANNDDTCDWESEDIEIIIVRDFVTLTDFQIPESVSCGSSLQVSADAWNIGDRDQDDVSISVTVRDLNFAQSYEITEVKSFESEKFEFSIPVPRNAQEKSYIMTFEVNDEDGDLFEEDFADNDEQSRFSRSFTVSCSGIPSDGGAPGREGGALVSASLVSGGKAGESLVVKANVVNTGDELATFNINAAGYSSWANQVELSTTSLVLPAGESEDVTLTFDVKTGVSGDQMFNIEVISGQDIVADQPVSVNIIAEGRTSLSDTLGGNWYLWLIGILNVILIVIIIIVAVRVSKR